jgi:hypothetical protein
MTPTPDATPQENILAEWMGDYAYLDTHALYHQFGKPEWFRALAAQFVAGVEQGRVDAQIEDVKHEFIAWAAMDLGTRRPQLRHSLAFHAQP